METPRPDLQLGTPNLRDLEWVACNPVPELCLFITRVVGYRLRPCRLFHWTLAGEGDRVTRKERILGETKQFQGAGKWCCGRAPGSLQFTGVGVTLGVGVHFVCVWEVVLEFGLYWNWKSLRDTLGWEVILGLGI